MNDDLVARLKCLEAGEAARSAINVYCLALDTGDMSLLRTAFTDDVRVRGQYMGDISGIDDALEYFESAVAGGFAHRKHYTMNSLITKIEDDAVTATCYFFSYHGETEDLKIAWGRYDYKTRLTPQGGAICDLEIILDQPVAGLRTFMPTSD